MKSREIRLRRFPEGAPQATDFEIAEVELAPPGPGEVLVGNLWLTVDPYMRGRMTGRDTYISGFRLGQPLEGGAIGRVIASGGHPKFQVGDLVRSDRGWREAFTTDGRGLEKIEAHLNSLHQRRRLLHRTPKIVLELRSRIFHSFERARQNSVGMNELAAQPVRGLRQYAVDFLRLAARQIYDVRRVVHHAGNFRLRIVQQDLDACKDGTNTRL